MTVTLSPRTFHRAFAVLALAAGLLLPPDVYAAPPSNADLRPLFENWGFDRRVQGKRPTCSVFTMAGAMEYLEKRARSANPFIRSN